MPLGLAWMHPWTGLYCGCRLLVTQDRRRSTLFAANQPWPGAWRIVRACVCMCVASDPLQFCLLARFWPQQIPNALDGRKDHSNERERRRGEEIEPVVEVPCTNP